MEEWYEIRVRAILGPEKHDDKEVVILGRVVGWTEHGIEYQADPKQRKIVLDYLGFSEDSKGLGINGDKEEKIEEWEKQVLSKGEAKEYRGVAARLNFLSLDCPDM
eukprot:3585602-Karenia_brevis.AAC.1